MLIYLNSNISKSAFITLLKDTVDNGKDFCFTPGGSSMQPLINGKTDTVTLTKKPTRLKKHDIALYIRRKDNALILHRVARVVNDTYTFSGDNQYYYDEGVPYSDILAVVKSVTRNGKPLSVKALSYNICFRIILIKKYIKIFIHKLKMKS